MNVKNILSDLEKSQNAMKAVLGKDFSTRVIRFLVDIGHGKVVLQ